MSSSSPGGAYRCERASSAHADGLLSLLESTGSGCFCNYWYFQGDKNAWLEQCFLRPEENRVALVARLAAPALCGVVALAPDGAVVGWLGLSSAAAIPKLYEQRVYKSLPCFQDVARERVLAVACFLVAEAERGRGVARALLESAIVEARKAGAMALEAFPRRAPEDAQKLRPDEVWLGPEALLEKCGFRAVSDFRPYPVLRLHLR